MVKDRTVQLTVTGKAKLEAELRGLIATKLPALHDRVQEANEHGDVNGNSEYENLKEELVHTEARIRELEQILDRAELVHREPGDTTIGLGSRVTLRIEDGEQETWTLVAPEEANGLEGTISTESPVGRALVGRQAGDATSVSTPLGAIVYTVVEVGT